MEWYKLFMQMHNMRGKMFAADSGAGDGAGDGAEDEGGEEDGEGGEGNEGGEGKKGEKGEGKKGKKDSFTQQEVNAISRKEKAKAKSTLLKSLFGTDDADEVAEMSERVKAFLSKDDGEEDDDTPTKKGSKKTESKDTKALEKAIKDRQRAESKAAKIQFKLDAIEKGVKPKYAGDFADLAFAKIAAGADPDEIVDELIEKYPFYTGSESDDEDDEETETQVKKGTGKTGGQKKLEKGKNGTGYAARLLEKQKNSGNEQGDFFKNNF